jgi:hypothetical protein
MMVTKQTLHVAGVVRSPQLQYQLSEALAANPGTEVDLRIGGLKAWGPRLLCGEPPPGVLLLASPDQSAVLIAAANRGTPVLDVDRYSRLGRELRSVLDRTLRELAAHQPLTAASAT